MSKSEDVAVPLLSSGDEGTEPEEIGAEQVNQKGSQRKSTTDDLRKVKSSNPQGQDQRTMSGDFAFGHKLNNPFSQVKIKEDLTSGWFDTKEDFEKHRARITKKLNKSVRDFNKISGNLGGGLPISDEDIVQSYVAEGGAKGLTLVGGPDAFDKSSQAGVYSHLMSDMDLLSNYDCK